LAILYFPPAIKYNLFEKLLVKNDNI